MRHGVAAALFCACAFSAPLAHAEFTCPMAEHGREKRARTVFEEAVQIEASDPEGALLRYQCAGRLADRPAIQLRIGVVAERLGKDDVAITAFERYLELAGASAPDAESMRQHVRELRDKRAKSTPGTTTPPSKTNASAGSGAEPRGSEPPPPPKKEEPPPTDPVMTYLGWGLVGAGVVSGIVGTGFLVDAKSKSDDVQALPKDSNWAEKGQDTYESAQSSQTVGIVFLALAPVII